MLIGGGENITSGNSNTAIGVGVAASSATVCNEVSIGTAAATARFQGAASSWTFVSDARDKENIRALPLGLEFVNKVQPRMFEWNLRDSEVDKGKTSAGFVAQELKELVERENAEYLELVDTNDEERYTIAKPNLIPVLVKAIQELSEELTNLKQEFNDYRSTHS
jgi:hypothetical protein